MKSRTWTKLMIDIVLTALFIVLIYPRETGFAFHEIAGLSMGALFIFHIMLNWGWVKNITKNLFNSRLKTKPKFFYLLNCLSLIGLATIVITGVQISRVVFPAQGAVSHTLVLLHKWAAYGSLGLLGLHLALHWRFFVQTVPRIFQAPGRPSWGKVAANVGAVALIFGLLYSQFATAGSGQTITRQEYQGSRAGRPRQSQSSIPPAASSSSTVVTPTSPSTPNSSSGSGQSGSGTGGTVQSGKENSISKSTSKSSLSVSSGTSSGTTDTKVTLAQYLGSLFCNGCDKHCSLLNPQCNRGIQQQEAAKQKYQALYAASNN